MSNDIDVAVSNQPIKNGSIVMSTTVTGESTINDLYANNTPVIGDIEDKYDNRFYNGIFVNIIGSGIIGI